MLGCEMRRRIVWKDPPLGLDDEGHDSPTMHPFSPCQLSRLQQLKKAETPKKDSC